MPMRIAPLSLAPLTLVLGLLFAAPAAWADEPAPACTAPVAPTGELASWLTPSPVEEAGPSADLAVPELALGQAARLSLHPADRLKLPFAPKMVNGNGGLVRFRVREVGTYRVALGTAAWIDVVADGKALLSASHGHGPACSGIRKIVDFNLMPGAYVVVLSGNAEQATQILVAKKP